jgi:uncharacterized membrane protein
MLYERMLNMFSWRVASRLVFALIALTAFAGSASAQVPPDQRRQMRQEMRDYWRQAPQDDRQRYRENRRDNWQPMPQDDRQRMRDEMRGRRDGYGGGYPSGGDSGRGQRGGRY